MDRLYVNELLISRIGFSDSSEIDEYREVYSKIIDKYDEEDFYWSMRNWWEDGNAPYYENWLKKNWRNE